jgi:hypothetical protein
MGFGNGDLACADIELAEDRRDMGWRRPAT